jgi:hypothetical protein
METHPRAPRNHLILALLAGGMLLAGALFLRSGASAEAAAAPQPAAPGSPCKPLVKVEVSLSYKEFVDPKDFTICQDHGPKGHYKLIWEKASGANFATFTAEFSKSQGTPFVDQNGHDQFVFHYAPGGPPVVTGHTKNLGLKPGQTRYYKYTIKVCQDPAETHCQERDPGGIIQP